ncbi:unnamed protein product, partial [marine sediment metagenome]
HAEPALDGNSYTYGPVTKVPADQSAWQQWQALAAAREQLFAELDETSEDYPAAIAYAAKRAGWSTSNWKISKPVSVADPTPPNATSTDAGWKNATGLPGSISGRGARGKLPGENQIVWVSFDVKTPADQTLDLTFGGSIGSHILLDDANVPVAEKDSIDRVTEAPLRLSVGTHRVRVAVYGQANLSELEVRIANRWDPLAKTKDWSACSTRQRLRMLADDRGPLSDRVGRDKAAPLDRSLAIAEANFTTSLIASELPTPRPTRLLSRGEYDLP